MVQRVAGLQSQSTPGGGNYAPIDLVYATDANWQIDILASVSNTQGVPFRPTHVIIDNFNNSDTFRFGYANFTYSVAPFTRKTFPIWDWIKVITAQVSGGTVTLTFCDFDPQVPDDVNQAASAGLNLFKATQAETAARVRDDVAVTPFCLAVFGDSLYYSIGTSGNTLPKNDTANIYSLGQTAPLWFASGLSASAPRYQHFVSNAAANAKGWWNYAGATSLIWATIDDANTTLVPYIVANRSGNDITSIDFLKPIISYNQATFAFGNVVNFDRATGFAHILLRYGGVNVGYYGGGNGWCHRWYNSGGTEIARIGNVSGIFEILYGLYVPSSTNSIVNALSTGYIAVVGSNVGFGGANVPSLIVRAQATTADGFEIYFGSNRYINFNLTGLDLEGTATIKARTRGLINISGALGAAAANCDLTLNGNITINAGVFDNPDMVTLKSNANRTITRGTLTAMYLNGVNVASATLLANRLGGFEAIDANNVILTGAIV